MRDSDAAGDHPAPLPDNSAKLAAAGRGHQVTASCQEGALMSGGRIAMIMKEADLRAGLNDPVTFEATMVQKLRTG